VALARAFLRDAPVVLLDEPTAQLDAASEAAVCEATARLVAGRTTLLVAHRPALLSLADRVVRLVGGRVVADVPADGRTPLAGAVPAGAGVVRPGGWCWPSPGRTCGGWWGPVRSRWPRTWPGWR